MNKLSPFLFLILLSCSSTKKVIDKKNVDPWHYTITKKMVVQNGAVVSAHPLASEVGVAILKKGGNAVDAAIATQLALAVVYPGAGNIGGGGFMVARLANGETLALDYREMAPSSASRDMYLDANGNVVQGKSINGHLSSGVPGSIAGMFASMKYAKLSFKELIQRTIDLAEKGFAISEREASSLNSIQQDLQKYNTQPSAFLNSKGWKAGDTLVQKDLANTLKLIRD